MKDELNEFLERLLGRQLDPASRLSLTSIQVGALHGWLKRKAMPYSAAALGTRGFTIDELVGCGTSGDTGLIPAAADTGAFVDTPAGSLSGVGIDIEFVANLPRTDDFRTHSFYDTNFSPEEISHCIGRADPYESFCGLWAGKEAIRKASGNTAIGMSKVAIAHDAAGRPSTPGMDLSISHSQGISIAVCVIGLNRDRRPETITPANLELVRPPKPEEALVSLSRSSGIATVLAIAFSIAALCISFVVLYELKLTGKL
jgi:phosphopantetheine--protein transferase-like protein